MSGVKSGSVGEPDDKGLQCGERRVDRRGGERLARPEVALLSKMRLEGDGLLDVELSKVPAPAMFVEAFKGFGDGFERRLVAAFHLLEELQIAPLHALVFGGSF